MDDATLLALCVWDEARGEPDDGKAAVARVVLNRARKHYSSDGTIAGTVLAPSQFSGFWFDMVDGHYTRVCHTRAEAEKRAEAKLHTAVNSTALVWSRCKLIADEVQAGTYHGPDYDHMTDDAVLYLNPAIVEKLPAWADPAKRVCAVGHHEFFRP